MDSALNLFSSIFTLSEKLETTVNKFYQRKDLTNDNKQQLLRLKRRLAYAKQLLSSPRPRAAHDNVVKTRLREFEETLTEDLERLVAWEKRIDSANVTNRVRRMKDILDLCEKDVNSCFEFLGSVFPPGLQSSISDQERYISRSFVPVNPPRLLLD